MAESLAIVGVLVVLNVAALMFGKDSRDGDDWVQHRW
jgi:hypothetical protein